MGGTFMSLWKSKKGSLKHISQSRYKIHFFNFWRRRSFPSLPTWGLGVRREKACCQTFSVWEKSFFIVFQIISVFLIFCLFAVGRNKWPDVLCKSVRKLERFFLFTWLCVSQLWSLHKVHTESRVLCFLPHLLAEFSTVIVLIRSFSCPSVS